MVLFVLFTPYGFNKNIWYQYNEVKTNFVDQLEKIGRVYIDIPIFNNYLQFDKSKKESYDSEYHFKLEDILFDNYCKQLYEKVEKYDNIVPIGLEESCSYAFYFANKYYHKCAGLFLIGNRRFTKENFEKSKIRGERMMKIDFGEGYEKLYNNINNDNLQVLLQKVKDEDNNKKYLAMLHAYVGYTVRSQYADLPNKCLVPTFIYNRITLSKDVMLGHNLKDERTKQIKDIHTTNEAILAHCTTNMDKYEADKILIKNSAEDLVKTYYIANENWSLFIYGTVGEEILEKIKIFVDTIEKLKKGGYAGARNNYYDYYMKYKSKYKKLANLMSN